MDRPPSSAFIRLSAFNVVPEPAKKSKTIASGLPPTIIERQSLTAYIDFGYENLSSPIIPLINLVPNDSAL